MVVCLMILYLLIIPPVDRILPLFRLPLFLPLPLCRRLPNVVNPPVDGKVDESKVPVQPAQAGGGGDGRQPVNAPPPPPQPQQQQNGNNAAAVPPGVARAMFRMFNVLSNRIQSAVS